MAKLVWSYLCLFDIVIELYAMDEKHSMTLLEMKVDSLYNKGLLKILMHSLFIIVEAFITLN